MIGRDLLRWACYVGMATLYIASVPWYRGSEEGYRGSEEGYRGSEEGLVLWLGIPDWAAVALLCYVGVAILNTVAWLFSDMPEDPAPLEDANGRPEPRL